MRRFLPHHPLLCLLLNERSEICNKLNAKDVNLKFIQYLQIITSLQGIPTMMKILQEQEGSHATVIHFDLCMIFHKKIWNGLNKKLITKSSNNLMIKTTKINKNNHIGTVMAFIIMFFMIY